MTLSHVYVAGFFDGEGTVGLYWNKSTKYWEPVVGIELRRERRTAQLLRILSDRYGTKVYYGANICRFRIRQRKLIRRFIKDILVHTTLKRVQLELLDSWLINEAYSYRVHQVLKSLKRR